MSLIWCGSEDIDFRNTVTNTLASSNTYYLHIRTSYVRESIVAGNAPVRTYPDFQAQSSDFWASFYCYQNYWGSVNSTPLCAFLNSSNSGIGFYCNPTDYKAVLKKTDGTVLQVESGASIFDEILVKYDFHIENIGSNGRVRAYLNGGADPFIDYTGDITPPSGDANVVRLLFGGITSIEPTYISEVIVATQDTRLWTLKTLAPNAAGDTNEWNGDYTAIDETANSDDDTVYTPDADETFTSNLTGMPTGSFTVKGVRVSARAADGTGGLGLQVGIKTNSTVDLSSTYTMGGYWQTVDYIVTENPVTSNYFTPAEIDALQFAAKTVTAE